MSDEPRYVTRAVQKRLSIGQAAVAAINEGDAQPPQQADQVVVGANAALLEAENLGDAQQAGEAEQAPMVLDDMPPEEIGGNVEVEHQEAADEEMPPLELPALELPAMELPAELPAPAVQNGNAVAVDELIQVNLYVPPGQNGVPPEGEFLQVALPLFPPADYPGEFKVFFSNKLLFKVVSHPSIPAVVIFNGAPDKVKIVSVQTQGAASIRADWLDMIVASGRGRKMSGPAYPFALPETPQHPKFAVCGLGKLVVFNAEILAMWDPAFTAMTLLAVGDGQIADYYYPVQEDDEESFVVDIAGGVPAPVMYNIRIASRPERVPTHYNPVTIFTIPERPSPFAIRRACMTREKQILVNCRNGVYQYEINYQHPQLSHWRLVLRHPGGSEAHEHRRMICLDNMTLQPFPR